MTGLFRADRWAVLELRASNEGLPFLSPSLWPVSILGEGQDCLGLRASSDHRFIVGALRARETVCLSALSPHTAHPPTFFAAAFSASATLSERRQ